MYSDALLIFVKNPEKGKVKTRLASGVGEDKALRIYLELMRHTREIAAALPVDRLLFYDQRIPGQDDWPAAVFQKHTQVKGDLGARMLTAFQTALEHHQKAVIIGSDCASLKVEIVEEAFRLLEEKDIVIGPAMDGGYYLLGMKKPEPRLFQNMTWSTETVFNETQQRVATAGKSLGLLPTLSDIDYAEDWEKYGWPLPDEQ